MTNAHALTATTRGEGSATRIDAWRFTDRSGVTADVTVPHSVVELSWCDWDESQWERVWRYETDIDVTGEGRAFLEFEGANTVVALTVNDTDLGSQTSGFLPVTWEITDVVVPGRNRVVVQLDSRWMRVPPMGSPLGVSDVDFFVPGGIHRPVWLLEVPEVYISDVRVRADELLSDAPQLGVDVTVDRPRTLGATRIDVEVRASSDGTLVAHGTAESADADESPVRVDITLDAPVRLWDIDDPFLHDVIVTLFDGAEPAYTHTHRTGFRDVSWRADGFFLNGTRRQLVGFNRHELYPYVGFAASPRAQIDDARMIKNELGANIVRSSHYPQSRAFLDACDELGLLVFDEVPGWQYAGTRERDNGDDAAPWAPVPEEDIDPLWQAEHLDQVRRMVLRDRHHPSVVVWSVFVNESRAVLPATWAAATAIVRELDDRATGGGSRFRAGGHDGGAFDNALDADGNRFWPFDVFGYNDYRADDHGSPDLMAPVPLPYLVTEAVGQFPGFHTFYGGAASGDLQHDQALHHARALDRANEDPGFAGLIAWVAFDYPTAHGVLWGHDDPALGVRGHRLKSSGVADVFRRARPGAAPYAALVDPTLRVVIAPAFRWDFHPVGQPDGPPARAAIASNCDTLELYADGRLVQTLLPDHESYPHSARPLFFADLSELRRARTAELRIDGFIDGVKRGSVRLSADTDRDRFEFHTDAPSIAADGIDSTRLVFGITDAHGNPRAWRDGRVSFTVDGPARIVGDNPFDGRGAGSSGAVWLVADPTQGPLERPTVVRVTATHDDGEPRELTVALTPIITSARRQK